MPDTPTLEAIAKFEDEIAALHSAIDNLVIRIGRLESGAQTFGVSQVGESFREAQDARKARLEPLGVMSDG